MPAFSMDRHSQKMILDDPTVHLLLKLGNTSSTLLLTMFILGKIHAPATCAVECCNLSAVCMLMQCLSVEGLMLPRRRRSRALAARARAAGCWSPAQSVRLGRLATVAASCRYTFVTQTSHAVCYFGYDKVLTNSCQYCSCVHGMCI